jgi:Leucine-rich repeat (LRR) protein
VPLGATLPASPPDSGCMSAMATRALQWCLLTIIVVPSTRAATVCTIHEGICSGEVFRERDAGYHMIFKEKSLSGTLPTELLVNIGSIRKLDLGFNSLSGTIPDFIYWHFEGEFIDLRGNRISGTLPPKIAVQSQLRHLSLAFNRISGVMPTQLGQLAEMKMLFLEGNRLHGTVPTELGHATNMEHLSLKENKFISGAIPSELGAISEFGHLMLTMNKISGSLPTQLGTPPKMQGIWADKNSLTGTLPTEFGRQTDMHHLVFKTFAPSRTWDDKFKTPEMLAAERLVEPQALTSRRWYQLSGTIPTEYFQLINLTHLDISSHTVSGLVPTELGIYTGMEHLFLGNNRLSGTVPTELGQETHLMHVALSLQRVSGVIPSQLGKLAKLKTLLFKDNNISGVVPSQLAEIRGIHRIYLGANNISGTILPEYGSLPVLRTLGIYGNFMSGTIPRSLALLNRTLLDCKLRQQNDSQNFDCPVPPLPEQCYTPYTVKELRRRCGKTPEWIKAPPDLEWTKWDVHGVDEEDIPRGPLREKHDGDADGSRWDGIAWAITTVCLAAWNQELHSRNFAL